jgi:hypothetical protein
MKIENLLTQEKKIQINKVIPSVTGFLLIEPEICAG